MKKTNFELLPLGRRFAASSFALLLLLLSGCSQGDLWEPDEKEVFKKQNIEAGEWIPTKMYPSQPELVSSADTTSSSSSDEDEDLSSAAGSSSSAVVRHQVRFVSEPEEGGSIRMKEDGEWHEVAGARNIDENSDLELAFFPSIGWKIDSLAFDDSTVLDASAVGASADSLGWTWRKVNRPATITPFFSLKSYRVVATTGEGGTVTPDTAMVQHGKSATFKFKPAKGYDLAEVTVDGTSVPFEDNAYVLANVTGPRAVHGVFALVQYRVTATVSGGHGAISPDHREVAHGGSATFTLTPDQGYVVDSVTVDGVRIDVVDNTVTLSNLDSSHAVVACFTGAKFTVTPSVVGGHGTVTPNTAQPAAYNGSVAFTFKPDAGYEIDTVKVGGHAVTATNNAYTVRNITGDSAVSVSFKQSVYTIEPSNMTPAGGSVSPAEPVQKHYGESQTFTFTPNTGYRVKSVKVDETEVCPDGGCTSYTLENIDAGKTLYVTFELLRYPVEVSVGAHGTMDPAGATVNVAHGQNQTFSWTPDTDYELDTLKVDGAPVSPTGENSYTFQNVTEGHSIAVTFRTSKFTIAASATGEGVSITPNGDVLVSRGATQAFAINVSSGYRIVSVLIDGAANTQAKTDKSYIFANVQENHTIAVTGEAIPERNLAISTVPANDVGGTASFAGNVTKALEGSEVSFSWTPEPLWKLDSVTVNGARIQNPGSPQTITVGAADQNVVVHFGRSHYTITATLGGIGASITPADTGLAVPGGSRKFTFAPTDAEQYRIDSVLIDGAANAGAKTAGEYTFADVRADHTIRVVGAQIPNYDVTMAKTSVCGNSGTVCPAVNCSVVNATTGNSTPNPFSIREGRTDSVRVTPGPGSQIDSLVVNGSRVTQNQTGEYIYRISNIAENKNVHAFFGVQPSCAGNVCTITAQAGEHGSISPSGDVGVALHKDSTFTITPADGYVLNSLTLNGIDVKDKCLSNGNGTACDFALTNAVEGGVILEAGFELGNSYTITVTAGAGGSITPGTGNVAEHGSRTYTITPNPHYSINQVLVDGEANAAAKSSGQHTFTDVTTTHIIEATFTADPKYGVTTTTNVAGKVTFSPNNPTNIWKDSVLHIGWTVDNAYTIDSVSVDGVRDDAAPAAGHVDLTMTGDHTLHVQIREKPAFEITTTAPSGGVTFTPANPSVPQGNNQRISWEIAAGYVVDDVQIDGAANATAKTNGYHDFNGVVGTHSVVVNTHAVPKYYVKSVRSANVTANKADSVEFNEGDNVSIAYTAASGYYISSATVDGNAQSVGSYVASWTYTANSIAANHEVAVNATALPEYTITASAGANGSISPSGSTQVTRGGSQSYTITPASGYVIAEVLVDGVANAAAKSSGSYTFSNVTAEHTISVTFEEDAGLTCVEWSSGLWAWNGVSYSNMDTNIGTPGGTAYRCRSNQQVNCNAYAPTEPIWGDIAFEVVGICRQ